MSHFPRARWVAAQSEKRMGGFASPSNGIGQTRLKSCDAQIALESSAFGGIADMVGLATGSTRSRMTHS